METFKGRVASKVVSRGSKSERQAVLLETESGEYLLRRRGGNPFRDDVLQELVGHEIAAEGRVRGKTLFLDGWEELAKEEDAQEGAASPDAEGEPPVAHKDAS